jgi:hypothetical protein
MHSVCLGAIPVLLIVLVFSFSLSLSLSLTHTHTHTHTHTLVWAMNYMTTLGRPMGGTGLR